MSDTEWIGVPVEEEVADVEKHARRLLFTMQKPAPIGEVKVLINEKGQLLANNWRVSLSWSGNLLFIPETQEEKATLPIDPVSGKTINGFSLTEEQTTIIIKALRKFRISSKTAPDPKTEAKIMLKIREKGDFLSVEEAMAFMPPELASIIESEKSILLVRKESDIKAIVEEAKQHIDKIIIDNGEYWKIGIVHFEKKKYKNKEDIIQAWLDSASKDMTLEKAIKEGYAVLQEEKLHLKKENIHLLAQIAQKYPSFSVQKPTMSGGFGVFLGPYHYMDNKTGKEVRLWEWGVDYDVG